MNSDRTTIQAIKERIDTVSVISRYVSLSKAGSSYKGRCPFHKDKTPSFVVSAEKGVWHCFGCGEGGDLFTFVMKIERVSFREALEQLAEEAGVEIGRVEGGEREELRKLTSEVADYFHRNLSDKADARKAREYLIERGYPEEIWDKFGFGYALSGWDDLKKQFASSYDINDLLRLGILSKGKGRVYDRFRDRLIFPIYDLSGRPIAFGGRAFEGQPKYLNSPQNPLFDKGRQLYGLSWARDKITSTNSAILVEGYTDVLSLHIAGIENTVGSMGTALTQRQADLIARFAGQVAIVYDRDSAGQAASLRGMQILRNSGLQVNVALLPEEDEFSEDPDSFVSKYGSERMQEIIDQAVPFHLFFVRSLAKRFDLSTIIGKEKALEEGRTFYQGIASLPLRQEIAKQIAERLNLSFEEVKTNLSRVRRRTRKVPKEEVEHEWDPEQVILCLLLRGEIGWSRVAALISPEDFSADNRAIAEAIASAPDNSELSSISDQLDEDATRKASYLSLAPVKFSDVDKALEDALRRMVELPNIEEKQSQLREKIRECEQAGDHDRLDELQKAYRELVAKKLARRGSDGKR